MEAEIRRRRASCDVVQVPPAKRGVIQGPGIHRGRDLASQWLIIEEATLCSKSPRAANSVAVTAIAYGDGASFIVIDA